MSHEQATKIMLKNLKLMKGSHVNPEVGMCVMEAVAYFANEPHSDAPQCACPALTAYMIRINDSFTEDERQLLKPFIKKLIGTRDGKALERAKILAWASITQFAPFALRAAGFEKEAASLEAVPHHDFNAAYSAASSAYSAASSAADAAADAAYYAAYSAYSAADAADAAYSAASSAYSAAYSAASAARKKVVEMAITALKEALAVK